jgi:hypothetical protein
MQQVKSEYPPGTVVVPTSGTPRYLEFYQSLSRLHVPSGTRLMYGVSADIAGGLNAAFAEATGDWVFLLGDDHTFEEDALLKLLRWRLPAVVGLNVFKVPPYCPVLLKGEPGAGTMLTWADVPAGSGLWYPGLDVYPGNAGLLTQRRVLDQMEQPWFRVGQFDPGKVMEDLYFVQQIKRVSGNFPVDLSVVLGHTNPLTAVPRVAGGRWVIDFVSRGKTALTMQPDLGPAPPAPSALAEDRIGGGL